MLFSAAGARAQTPAARVTAVSPASPGLLRPNGAVYARIEYESSQPLRFQARGRLEGREVEGARMNPSPVYPAGKREAIAWISFGEGIKIDEIHIVVSDDRWRELTRVAAPATVEWSARATDPSRPEWVATLNDSQQLAVGQSMQDMSGRAGGAVMGIFSLLFLLVPLYPVLQIVAWKRLVGRARIVSALPLAVMIPVYVFSAFALSAGSNLWPIWIVFISPPASIFVGIVLLVSRSRSPQSQA